MKPFLFALAIFISTISFAQDSRGVKVKSPKIVSKLYFGKTIMINNTELKFVKLISDSRCPKKVTCIWAGEAKVLVDVFENGVFLKQTALIFSPGKRQEAGALDLIYSENLQVSGFNILPYPVSDKKTKMEDYYIQLDIRKK